jgi:enoyl-CoA hydratase/carnithine racemase
VGADLKERQGMNEKDILVRFEFVRPLYERLENLPFPTIAAINGLALGGGLELALCCDLRVASRDAMMSFPELELAIIPGNGGTQRLPRLIGKGKAMECILLAKRFSASEAKEIGLVNQAVGSLEALPAARALASRMLELGPISLRAAKQAIRKGLGGSLGDGLKLEIEHYKACLYSKDRMEGLKAFSQKRKPQFTGE